MLIKVVPSKIKFYINTSKKTPAQVKQETGANIVINSWLFNMSKFTAIGDVKVDGKVLADTDTSFGYGFNAGQTRMTLSDNMNLWENYMTCYPLVRNSAAFNLKWAGTAILGARPRSAIGFKSNGECVVFCTQSNTTLAQLQSTMLNQGCVDALDLDGGGSSQIASDWGNLSASRKVHGFICIWGKIATESPEVKCNLNVILTNPLNVRSGPSTNYPVLKQLPNGTVLTVTGKNTDGTWYYTTQGWVIAKYCVIKTTSTVTTTKENCPYSEPILVIKQRSSGNGAKWVQWYLNKLGYVGSDGKAIDVDGNFGANSVYALKAFQKAKSLTVDGKCGSGTRKALKAAYN